MAASKAGMKAARSCSQEHCCGSGTWDLRSFDKDGGSLFGEKKQIWENISCFFPWYCCCKQRLWVAGTAPGSRAGVCGEKVNLTSNVPLKDLEL